MLGTSYEWPPRTSSALDTLLGEIQNAREQLSRLETLIRSYAAKDLKSGRRIIITIPGVPTFS